MTSIMCSSSQNQDTKLLFVLKGITEPSVESTKASGNEPTSPEGSSGVYRE
jgi:hypothetical protein